MADNTIIQQGRFTSTGAAKTLSIRSDVDWMKVYNFTIADADQTNALATEFYWQRGFASGRGIAYKKSNAANAANLIDVLDSPLGFTLVDSSGNPLGLENGSSGNADITAISNAAIPVATNNNVNGLVAGDVVRLYSVVGAPQLSGFDFTVGYNTLGNTTFSLDYMSQLAVAGTTADWRQIKFNPLYYPRHRYITKISRANSAVVTLSVTHGYQVGQAVRFVVPSAYGMVEMDGLIGTITAIDTVTTTGNTITVNIDSNAFSTFAFPAAAAAGSFSPAMVVPVGEDTAVAIAQSQNILSDATNNEGFLGMVLAGGAGSPGGANTNVMYWVAGKSFSVNNE